MPWCMSPCFQEILYSVDTQGIATVTLNRPEKRNPIGATTLVELGQGFSLAKVDPKVRVVVLTGAGSCFSAGGDLADLSQPHSTSQVTLAQLLQQMHALGKPIVARVNGHALAGGLGLMIACDLVIASDCATFGTTEIKVGLWPMMITAELVRNVGRKNALEMMLSGRRMSAEEALRIGLITRLVVADDLDREVAQVALSLAQSSASTLKFGLEAFYGTQDMPYEPALQHLQGQLQALLETPDAREGLTAFVEKRAPQWQASKA